MWSSSPRFRGAAPLPLPTQPPQPPPSLHFYSNVLHKKLAMIPEEMAEVDDDDESYQDGCENNVVTNSNRRNNPKEHCLLDNDRIMHVITKDPPPLSAAPYFSNLSWFPTHRNTDTGVPESTVPDSTEATDYDETDEDEENDIVQYQDEHDPKNENDYDEQSQDSTASSSSSSSSSPTPLILSNDDDDMAHLEALAAQNSIWRVASSSTQDDSGDSGSLDTNTFPLFWPPRAAASLAAVSLSAAAATSKSHKRPNEQRHSAPLVPNNAQGERQQPLARQPVKEHHGTEKSQNDTTQSLATITTHHNQARIELDSIPATATTSHHSVPGCYDDDDVEPAATTTSALTSRRAGTGNRSCFWCAWWASPKQSALI
jgi:hypothetical protein